uniref:Odorant receptor n=1 Tax=Epiphyas postvittana TaxID=65032 RepID=A0A0K8TUU3_EPIPO
MKNIIGMQLRRYLPVFKSEHPKLVNTIQRLIWNTGVWSNESMGLHWMAKLVIVCFFSTNFTQLAAMIIERDDSERVFECFSVLSFCGMGALKLLNLYLNRERWLFIFTQITLLENKQLNNAIDKQCDDYDTDDEEECLSPHIQRYTRKHTYTASLLLTLYSTTAVIFILAPFVEYALQHETKGYPHILPGWAPLDAVGFAGYFVSALFEVIGSIYCVFVHVAFDCTSVGVMIFICGQFAMLRESTENIGGRGRGHTISRNRDARARLRIAKTHSTHIILCNVINELGSTLRTILGVYFLVATLTVCSVAVRLNTQTLSFMQLVSLLQYMCGTLTQLFLFCRYGDAVFHESFFSMGEGPFGAAWWGLQPRVRRELAMLGAAMAKPRPLRAGPFNTLDLPSFVQIVRAAYSYYAVLGQTSK